MGRYFAAVLPLLLATVLLAGQSKAPTDGEQIETQIKRLGSPVFGEREAAARDLMKSGEAALRPLRIAARSSTDPEVRKRATELANQIVDKVSAREWFRGPTKEGVDRLWIAALSPGDAETVLTLSHDSPPHIGVLWRLKDQKELVAFDSSSMTGAALAPKSQRFLTSHRDGSIRFWDATSGKEIRSAQAHNRMAYSVALTANERYAVSSGGDGLFALGSLTPGS
jgi:WD40 repeat protein